MDREKLKALVKLLDDPDPEVYKAVEQSLMKEGLAIIPELEMAWESNFNQLLQQRIENITQAIQFNATRQKLSDWADAGATDLLEGAFLIAKYQYPDLETESIKEKIEKIKRDVWIELNENLTALEKVKIINHIIYNIYKYSRNSSNLNSPQNSYINNVLDTKKGNNISLSIVYIIIAQMLEMPIYGVNLPKNFILAYSDKLAALEAFGEDENESVLFYINPSNNGAVFGKNEIDFFIKEQKLEHNKSYYTPCSNIITIQRLIDSLIFSYEQLGYPNKIKDLKKLRVVVELTRK